MGTGFFIVNRSVFQHYLFDDEPFCRGHAWLWIVSEAAWRPTERRTKRGPLTVDRGQLTVNERELAQIFNWSKSTVRRFLLTLVAEKMIVLSKSGPQVGPHSGPHLTHEITVLTICNYDSFQARQKTYQQQVDHRTDHRSDQQSELPLQKQEVTAPNNSNHSNQGSFSKSGFEGKGKAAPADGQSQRAKGMIFARLGSQLWAMYAADYRDVMGAEPLPAVYDDGVRGRWFTQAGAATMKRTGS